MSAPDPGTTTRPRRPQFQKYFVALFVAVVVPLLANGASEAWFGYRDQRVMLSQRLRAEADTTAGKIQGFLDNITDQLQWTVQLPWREGADERHRFDILRLFRQVPAIVEVTLVDGEGVERLHVSRVDPDIVNGGADYGNDPAVTGARSGHIWYGPVTLHEGSEPRMTLAVAGAREINGVTVAVINLKLIWDVVSAIQIGQSGDAFVLDRTGRLVAHPDISLVLRGDDDPGAARLKALQQATIAGNGETADGTGAELERLATRFNEMAGELALSQERSERIGRLKRFLAPQVAELVEGSDQESLLDSHHAEVVVIFCDLRGFTGFSDAAAPEEVMGLLQEYYEALGAIITRYEATLTCFMADGLMLLLNAPVPRPEPTLLGVRMVLEMRAAVRDLIVRWRARGHAIGFGVGLAKGTATV